MDITQDIAPVQARIPEITVAPAPGTDRALRSRLERSEAW